MRPVSLAVTEFHILLLAEHRLVAINRLSKAKVFDETFEPSWGTMRVLAPDPIKKDVFLISDKFVFEVEIESEERDVWKLYLDKKEFENAHTFCNNGTQREQVLNAHADYHFSALRYEEAAAVYAKTARSFEEVTLKFVDSEGSSARNALKTYLLTKLFALKADDLIQQTMICTWLVEIFLTNIDNFENDITDAEEVKNDAKAAEIRIQLSAELDVFKQFLEYNDYVLNKPATYELLSSHGRTNELVYFANLLSDFEYVLSLYAREAKYAECLDTLGGLTQPRPGQPHEHAELFYKFAPLLFEHVASEMVDLLVQTKGLDPGNLIPGLMRYETTRGELEAKETNEAIRYLEHCVVRKEEKQNPVVHNFLVTLYCKQTDEEPLLQFIRTQTVPLYDYKYALRLCHQQDRKRCMVAIYTIKGHFEEAVLLALEVDVAEAKQIVSKSRVPEEKKKLWLLIARHVIKQETGGDVSRAIAVLKECPQYLQLEDILPFFPDFAEIGQFKQEICEALTKYSGDIEQLRETMGNYTDSAEKIRADLEALNRRSGVIRYNQQCDTCSLPLLTQQFIYFPCTHAFHVSCCESSLKDYFKRNPGARAEEEEALRQELRETKTKTDPSEETRAVRSFFDRRQNASKVNTRQDRVAEEEAALSELASHLASRECVLCNAVMVDSVQRPFILPDENLEVLSWEI
jgi:hypothetical protein